MMDLGSCIAVENWPEAANRQEQNFINGHYGIGVGNYQPDFCSSEVCLGSVAIVISAHLLD
jgi:hypothetical protein